MSNIRDICEQYLAAMDSEGRLTRSLKAAMGKVILYLGDIDGDAFRTEDAERYRLLRRKEKRPPSHATINRQLSYLRSALKRAFRARRIGSVPWIPMAREHGRRTDWWPPEVFTKLYAYLVTREACVADILLFAFWTGWRKREVLELVWSEVKFEAGVIELPPERNKAREPRVFPLTTPLRQLLERRRAVECGPYVFHRRGEVRKGFRRHWAGARKALGLSKHSFHGFRRTFATLQCEAGIPFDITMKLAGWRSDSIRRRYNIVQLSAQAEAMERFQAYVESRRVM